MHERVSAILRNPLTIPITTGVVAFAGGFFIGYTTGNRRVKKKEEVFTLADKPEVDLDLTVDDLEELKGDGNEETVRPPRVIIDEEALRESSKPKPVSEVLEVVGETPVEEVVSSSVFADGTDEWNLQEELTKRTSSEPYVIHKDEYFANETEFAQHTLTYYEGDDILVDENDAPVYNHSTLTGPLLFGHGSDDPNVVYIRNEHRRTEWEIIRDRGLYSVEVEGLQIEENDRDVQHSAHRRHRLRD